MSVTRFQIFSSGRSIGDHVRAPSAQRFERGHLGTGADERNSPAGKGEPLGVLHDPPDRDREGWLDDARAHPGAELRFQLAAP